MGSGGDGDQTQTTEPWDPQQKYLRDIFSQAQNWYQNEPAQYFPGSTVAAANPNQQQAQQRVVGYSQGGAQQLADQAAQQSQFLSGPVIDPDTNKYLAAYGRAAIQPLVSQFENRVMPQIDQQAVAAGGVGDTRHGVAQGIASEALAQGISQTLAPIYSEAYGQGLDAYLKNLALAPQTIQAGTLPGQFQAAVGQAQQGQSQAEIDANVARHNFEQNQPLQRLFDYRNLIQGQYGGTSELQGGGGPGVGGRATGALGGAMMGASLGSAIPGIGTGVGAGVGLLIGLLGSG